jgi:pimeloyl-ACP methyl ester carboxylesterase
MRLHYQAHGEGFPLVVIHGFLGSSDNWRAMNKRLGGNFKVHGIDLRNHGASPHSDTMNYPVMADDLGEFLETQQIRSTQILGHSMGGKVAMQLALTHSDPIARLIAVDIAPRAYAPKHRTMLAALRDLKLAVYRSFGEFDKALEPQISEPAVRQFLIKNLARSENNEFRWRLGLDEISQNYAELTKAVAAREPFGKPACFICAGRSNFIEDNDLPAIRKNFPKACFKTISEAGHWVHIDAPDEFYKIVVEFLTTGAT